MIRVLICDDDAVYLNRIYDSISECLKQADCKAKIHKFSAMEQISDQLLASCDLAFLDVDFPGANYNGMDVARRLRRFRKDAVIIFVTNFVEYAPEGYEVQAFRYILKRNLHVDLEPYLLQALDRLGSTREIFKIQSGGEYIDIPLEDILYLEVMQHNVTVYVSRGIGKTPKQYEIYSSLSELEGRLESLGFLRIHKSYLVNMRHLIKFQCKGAVLDHGITLRVGEKAYSENKKKYLLWKGW